MNTVTRHTSLVGVDIGRFVNPRLSVLDFVSQLPEWKPGFEAKDLYMSLMLLVLLDSNYTLD